MIRCCFYYQSSGSHISGCRNKQERRDENQKWNKIYHKTFIQLTVGYRDAIKLLMAVFGQSWQGVRWKMLTNDEYFNDITATTCFYFYLLLHLILSTKIINSAITFVVNWYTISLTKLTDLAQSVIAIGLFKMEATTCKYKVQVLYFHYMLVTIRKKLPYVLRHIGLKLLVHL